MASEAIQRIQVRPGVPRNIELLLRAVYPKSRREPENLALALDRPCSAILFDWSAMIISSVRSFLLSYPLDGSERTQK
jgi:hypothetical protein